MTTGFSGEDLKVVDEPRPLASMSSTNHIRLAFLVEDYTWNIPVKFGQNRPSGIGGVVIKTKLLMTNPDNERRRSRKLTVPKS